MKLLSILIWFFLSQMVPAQTVIVKSGDHPGFTRLVLELPKAADWQMGRTAEGYELRIADKALRFDVSEVFKDIQRNRLAAIWMDPDSGGLRLGIACACHALPFEFRAGIIVIDLREGPPPKGSSFELALDGTGAATLAARPVTRPRGRPHAFVGAKIQAEVPRPTYDWMAEDASNPSGKQRISSAPQSAAGLTINDTGPFKDALLRQLSRGAAQGIIQMAKPNLASRNTTNPAEAGPRANIRLGEAPGFAVAANPGPKDMLIKDGTACVADNTLDITGWGSDEPASIQLANSRANLIGEFDHPNSVNVALAVKILIHLGFGAEAGQLLEQMPVDRPDSPLWKSMAKIVDGASDAEGPFAGMQTCDTAAALWATLAMPELTVGARPRLKAVLRAFSALPAHLRRGLGPSLAAKFLAIGEVTTARSISNSVQRSVSETAPDVAVMDARIDLASGDSAAATAHLAPILAQAGPNTAATLIALVDAGIASGDALDPATAIALAALIREQSGSDLEPALRRAQILSLASAGDFDQAFALLPKMPSAELDLWQVLARSGSNTAILNHAVMRPDTNLPSLSADDRSQLAGQLSTLGLPDAALVWIGTQSENTSDASRLIAAKAYLSKGDADASLTWLGGLDDSAALGLRAEALWRQGKLPEAVTAWAKAGNTDAELRAQSWAQNWEALSKNDASSWQAAAGLLTAQRGADVLNAPGPLALGNALVAESSTTRATLIALLASIPEPEATK